MSVIVHIQISGRDRPNAVGDLITILARHAVPVLDLNQRMACGTLSLGVLAALPEAPDRCPTFKELEARAMDLELTIHPHVIPANAYRTWVAEQRASRHVLTLLGREVGAKPIAEAAGLAAALGLRITGMTRLSAPREGDAEGSACFEMDLHGPTPDASALHDALPRLAEEMGLDLVLQEDDAFRRHRRLICFDMDSTLIQAEVIDELAAEVGIEAQVAAITESAMRGEIDFPESFRRRMALLKGLDESVLTRVAERLPITEGAARLIANLKARGYKTAILSGGFTYFAQCLSKRLGGIDYIHANTLDFRDGRLTGEVSGESWTARARRCCCAKSPRAKAWSRSRSLPWATAPTIFPCSPLRAWA